MEIKLDGIVEVNSQAGIAMKFLADGKNIADCIPESSDFAKTAENEFSVKIKMGIGFVNGKFEVKYSLVDIGSNHAEYDIRWSGMGNDAKIVLSFVLSEEGNSTRISWNANCTFRGIITGMGEMTIKNIANDFIKKISGNVAAKLQAWHPT